VPFHSETPFCCDCGVEMMCIDSSVRIYTTYGDSYFRSTLYECPECQHRVCTGHGGGYFQQNIEDDAGIRGRKVFIIR